MDIRSVAACRMARYVIVGNAQIVNAHMIVATERVDAVVGRINDVIRCSAGERQDPIPSTELSFYSTTVVGRSGMAYLVRHHRLDQST